MKKDYWRWIERGISVAAIAGMFITWQVDRAKWSTKLDILIKNDEKREAYWNNQNTINGKFVMLYDYFIKSGAGEETNP